MSFPADNDKQAPKFGQLRFYGFGVDQTPVAELDKITTPIITYMSPMDRKLGVAMLQGGMTAGFSERGIGISWKTVYGYYRSKKQLKGEEHPSKWAKHDEKQDWEKYASDMGYHAFKDVFDALQQVDEHKYMRVGEDWIEMVFEDLEGLEALIFHDLNNRYFKQGGKLRDDAGHYRWIGLSTESGGKLQPPTTQLAYERFVRSEKDLILTSTVEPFESSSENPTTIRTDGAALAVMTGIVAAFEKEERYEYNSAVRTALLNYVFSGDFRPVRVLAAAARAGYMPRMGSSVDTGAIESKRVEWFAKRLFALGKTWEWFKLRYPELAFGRQTCTVKYGVPATGLTSVILDELTRYSTQGLIQIKDAKSGVGSEGLFFLPAQNGFGVTHRFAFVENANEIGSRVSISMTQGPIQRAEYTAEPLMIGKKVFMDLTEAQQMSWMIQPVVADSIETVYQRTKWLGGGLKSVDTVIKDRVYPEEAPSLGSAMVKTLIAGWRPAFEPNALLLNEPYRSGATLHTYKDFGFYLSAEV